MPPFKRKFVPSSTKQRGDDEVEKIDVANEEKSTEGDWLSETIENDDEQSDANDSDYASSDGENLEPVFGESESGEEENDADDDDDGDNDDEYDDEDEDNSEQEVEDSDDNLRNEDAEISQIQTSISSNVKVSDNNKNAPNKKLTEKNRKTNQTKSGNSKSNKQFGAKCTKNDISSNTVDSDTTKTKVMKTQIADLSQDKNDEYVNDSSDEEDIRNTVGNIPMNWYDDYPHLGYDWDGKKIFKPQNRDQLDEFLSRMEDPDYWRTVKDSQTGQNVVLSDADVELIERMQSGKIPDKDYDEYAPWIEWFTSEKMNMPAKNYPNHKRSYLPSKSDQEKIAKLVRALKMGWIKTEAELEKEREAKKQPKFYMLWRSDDTAEKMRRIHNHIPAPKRLLPGHAESYNPPSEYLFDKKELKEWKKQTRLQQKRKLHFLPQKYSSLREVPAYDKFIYERFQRCLDLYLCPRGRKMRLTIEPEDLIPQLPSPKDLQPFPTVLSIVYKGHTDMVRTLTIDGKGQYLASGSDDMTLKVWEVSTGRCLKSIPCGGIIRSISWCPSQSISLILVAADRKVLLINPGVGDSLVSSKTDVLLEEPPESDVIVPERVKAVVQWEAVSPTSEEWLRGIRIVINHFKEIAQVSWHGRGDYFSTVMPEGSNRSVMIHQLSKRRSQVPFSKSKGLVQCVLFHPIKPILFVATQKNIRIYDLLKQELIKKLLSNSKWISTMAIHPAGDNLLVGTYDRKMLWFDLDLSTEPYQTLRLHGQAVRSVAYHKRYPLFASGSDDRNVIVSHGMVYNDLLQNPLIVPLKRLVHHETNNDFGVFAVLFHPTQPWLFSGGADGKIFLYT
ncbi:hypothetical protein RUM44_011627 [Polyplax serrata]|uniref:Ribosome biogenesis protein BOP1 homolog n=1 Tax=Polyplax serrata TaxID=468196 RepID=A0ABR1AR86_POLSC